MHSLNNYYFQTGNQNPPPPQGIPQGFSQGMPQGLLQGMPQRFPHVIHPNGSSSWTQIQNQLLMEQRLKLAQQEAHEQQERLYRAQQQQQANAQHQLEREQRLRLARQQAQEQQERLHRAQQQQQANAQHQLEREQRLQLAQQQAHEQQERQHRAQQQQKVNAQHQLEMEQRLPLARQQAHEQQKRQHRAQQQQQANAQHQLEMEQRRQLARQQAQAQQQRMQRAQPQQQANAQHELESEQRPQLAQQQRLQRAQQHQQANAQCNKQIMDLMQFVQSGTTPQERRQRMQWAQQHLPFNNVGSMDHPGSQPTYPPAVVASSSQSHTQWNQVSNRSPNRSTPNLVQRSATPKEVPPLQDEDLDILETLRYFEQTNPPDLIEIIVPESKLETSPKPEPVTFKPVASKPVQEVLVQQDIVANATAMSIPVLIESFQPIIVMPSLGPEPRSVPEPEASTSRMPRLEPRSVPESVSTSRMPSMTSLERRSLPKPEASTSSMTSTSSLGPRSKPEPEASTSSMPRYVPESASTSRMPSMTSREPRSLPEPEASTPSMPSTSSFGPSSKPEPEASTSRMPSLEPRPESRFLPEPETFTSSMPSMPSLGPRSVPEPEASTSSTTSNLEVNRKHFPLKLKSKTTYQAVTEEKTSSIPIIESGSGYFEPSPSTSRHSSTTSDLEINDEKRVGGKKRKRKPKKLYRALAEDDSTEYETDDEEPMKVQKTAGWKTDKYKSQPEKENLPQLSTNKITNTAAKIESQTVGTKTPKDLSKSEIRKSKAWQSRWNTLYDKLHFDALNKHLDNIFSSKTLGFETKKSFKGEGKTNIIKANKIIIEKCKNENEESTIVPKTKCKHLVNDNSDSDYHSNSDNTLNYVVDSQMDYSSNYSSGQGQVNTQQDHLASIKPFNCNFCDLIFTQKINMENHIAIVHEGKKPYTCDLCKKVFWKESHLNIHLTLKHERQKNLDSTGINVREPQSIFVYGNLKPTELAFPLMCGLAIQSSPVKKMSVSEIYTFIKKHWPYFQTAKKTWFEKTVRDAMRNNKFFEYTNQVAIKIKKSDGKMNRGRNGKYYILSKSMGKKMKSELKKYVSNNQQEIQASTSNPEVFLWIDNIEEETEQAINRVKIPKESRIKRVLKKSLKLSTFLTDGHVNTEAKPEPGPKPELIIKSKSEPRPKPEPIKTKPKPRPKPELIESKPEPRPKPELIESKPESRPKPEHIESKPEPRPKPELILL